MQPKQRKETAVTQALEGWMGSVDLRPGLTLHWADILVRHSAKQKTEVPAGVSLIIILAGSCAYGWLPQPEQKRVMRRAQCGCALLTRTVPGKVVRELRCGEALRHIGLSFSPEWLEKSRIQMPVAQREPEARCYPLTRRIQAQSEALLSLLRRQVDWKNLQLESRSLALLAECLSHYEKTALPPNSPALSPHQNARLNAIRAFLDTAPAMNMSLSEIARRFATNPTSLQQQFRQMFGVTLFTVLRNSRMQYARQMLMLGASVAEVSNLTGFANPSSFCVAFKKRFHCPPSQCRRQPTACPPQ